MKLAWKSTWVVVAKDEAYQDHLTLDLAYPGHLLKEVR